MNEQELAPERNQDGSTEGDAVAAKGEADEGRVETGERTEWETATEWKIVC